MAACMLFDIFFGLTYFAAGTWRTYIFFNWDCEQIYYLQKGGDFSHTGLQSMDVLLDPVCSALYYHYSRCR